jgi:hypothetical protein
MKSNRHKKYHKKTRKNHKGGFVNFFSKKSVAPLEECDINNLSSLSKDMGDGVDPLNKMHANYQKCCPKNYLGQLNSSPYCKQLKMNFDSQSKYQNDIAGYYGEETDVEKIKQAMSGPVPIDQTQSKPWYKFWGGKSRRKHKKHSRKQKKHRK